MADLRVSLKKNWLKKKKANKELERGVSKGNREREYEREKREEHEGEGGEPETVLFIPSTPRGELMKAMREADRDFRRGTTIRPIKFVERAGVSIADTLVQSNPWGDMKCGRLECFVCRGDRGGIKDCMKQSVLYSIKCEDCKERGKRIEYWGETGRDGFVRGGEHIKGCREKSEKNALYKHLVGDHGGK